MDCHKCKMELPLNAKYCPNCGTKIIEKENEANAIPSSNGLSQKDIDSMLALLGDSIPNISPTGKYEDLYLVQHMRGEIDINEWMRKTIAYLLRIGYFYFDNQENKWKSQGKLVYNNRTGLWEAER